MTSHTELKSNRKKEAELPATISMDGKQLFAVEHTCNTYAIALMSIPIDSRNDGSAMMVLLLVVAASTVAEATKTMAFQFVFYRFHIGLMIHTKKRRQIFHSYTKIPSNTWKMLCFCFCCCEFDAKSTDLYPIQCNMCDSAHSHQHTFQIRFLISPYNYNSLHFWPIKKSNDAFELTFSSVCLLSDDRVHLNCSMNLFRFKTNQAIYLYTSLHTQNVDAQQRRRRTKTKLNPKNEMQATDQIANETYNL